MSKLTMAIVLLASALLISGRDAAGATSGRIIDAVTKAPIADAQITIAGEVTTTDANGRFTTSIDGMTVAARAPGYLRIEQELRIPFATDLLEVRLTPFTPKALYLSGYGLASKSLRESALKLIAETELNALVIDVKGDWGQLSYRSTVPLASEIGAQKVMPVKDIEGVIKELKAQGIYLIARIVVFKDNPLARVRTDLAVRTSEGTVWRDREGQAWVDPYQQEGWNYNLSIAEEAAKLGFDEIQFDYLRFPDHAGLKFSRTNTEENRIKTIGSFLEEARRRLVPYNVFLSVDIFGYVCWNLNDTAIGQRLPDIASSIDYLAPMLYPSGFQFGIPGYQYPIAHPYQIVRLSLDRARQRTNIPAQRFRPWLQAFHDYAFDRRQMIGQSLRDQIDAAESFGANGWMLWNPANIYSRDGLK
jgi:hypothetical protein